MLQLHVMKLERTDPNGYDFAPAQLSQLAQMRLAHARAGDAIAIMQLNSTQFPKDPDVYRGLGDACEKWATSRSPLRTIARSLKSLLRTKRRRKS
jgi:predicted Zn-dependent protease